ncbi:undecaprenyl-diphosphatase [Paenibacillus illinoisensis]|uniref:undecaprenyl-diphosphatase n=1 Tax=Paenibacillus illinoisensis TaxID=59845 RepID=UPI00301B8D90
MNISQFDYQLFHVINEWGESFSSLNPIMSFLAEWAMYLFVIGLLVYWCSRKKSYRKMVVSAVVSVVLGLGISFIIGHLFYRDRPFVDYTVLKLIPHQANASFPSDHSIIVFAVAVQFLIYRRKEGLAWLALASMIAFSRVWTGVHYPLDVVGGAFLGTTVSIGVQFVVNRYSAISRLFNTCLKWYESYESKILPRFMKKDEFTVGK